ncbi:MAG: dockerin type I domain-containing protein, partial [Planctomycetota bacterium]|nr:dockerin type I domain-containing protein [Planctomycetota bacterium]
ASVSSVLSVVDVNEPPTAVTLTNTVTSLPENTTVQTRVADLVVTDDALGTNTLGLAGADMAMFEIIGTSLYLKANQTLDFETHPQLHVTVNVDDVTVGTTPDASVSSVLSVVDVNEPPTSLTLHLSSSLIDEHGTTVLSGSFADPDTRDTHQVSIDWGDGSAATTLNLAANVLIFSADAHQYRNNRSADAPYTVRVTVTDPAGASVAGETAVTVKNVAPSHLLVSLTLPPDHAAGTVILAGSFADPGTLDAHAVTIDWGDGTSATTLNLAAGTTTYGNLLHRYLDQRPGNAPYTVRVTVADEALSTVATATTALAPWLDYGDAPDSYRTLRASNGPRHAVGSGLFLGVQVTADADGRPAASALGDRDDGVTFGPILRQGVTTTVRVIASQAGRLDAFLDFNADGDFADAGEQIFNSVAVVAGENNLSFSIPAGAASATTYARFRLSSVGGLSFDGRASDGEVEDYRVTVGLGGSCTQLAVGRYQCDVVNATPGGVVTFAYGTVAGATPLPAYHVTLGILAPVIYGLGAADATGHAAAILNVPSALIGHTLLVQAFEQTGGSQVTPVRTFLVESSLVGAHPTQNPVLPEDVNDDGWVTPLDVLLVINYVNASPAERLLLNPADAQPPYFDVTGDEQVTPQDVLVVINWLNNQAWRLGEGEAGSEYVLPVVAEAPFAAVIAGNTVAPVVPVYAPVAAMEETGVRQAGTSGVTSSSSTRLNSGLSEFEVMQKIHLPGARNSKDPDLLELVDVVVDFELDNILSDIAGDVLGQWSRSAAT